MGKLIISSELEKALFTLNNLVGIVADEAIRIGDVSLTNQAEASNRFTDLMVESMAVVAGLITDEILSQVK